MRLAELVYRTREGSRRLPQERAIVAWFGGDAALRSRYIPLESLSCAVLLRGRRKYFYYDGTRMRKLVKVREEYPVLMAVAPVIYYGNSLIIGDDGWRRYRKASKVHYTQDVFPGAEPVGAIKDVLCEEFKNPLSLIVSSDHPHSTYHRKLLRWAYRMQDETLMDPGTGRGNNQSVFPPTFLVPRRRTSLLLRLGEELEQWALHCSRTGRWSLPGGPEIAGHVKTVERGEARTIDAETVHYKCTVKDGQFEDNYLLDDAVKQYEKRIDEVFDRQDVAVPLVPLLPSARYAPVRNGQALFGPVPKKDWSLEEFRALPEETRRATFYLAALNAGQIIDDIHYLDFSHAFGDEVPIVDLQSLNGKLQGVENTPHGLSYQTDGIRVDMLRFVRYHLKLRVETRKQLKEQSKQQRKVRKKAVSKQPVAVRRLKGGEVDGNVKLPPPLEETDLEGNVVPPPLPEKTDIDGNATDGCPAAGAKAKFLEQPA